MACADTTSTTPSRRGICRMDSLGVHPWTTIYPFHSQCKSQNIKFWGQPLTIRFTVLLSEFFCYRGSSLHYPTYTRPPLLPIFTLLHHFFRWQRGTHMCLPSIYRRNSDDNFWRNNQTHVLSVHGKHVHCWEKHPHGPYSRHIGALCYRSSSKLHWSPDCIYWNDSYTWNEGENFYNIDNH